MELNRKILFLLSLFTLVAFSVIGMVMIVFLQERTLVEVFNPATWLAQLGYGIIYGLGVALIAVSLVETKWLEPVTNFFRQLFASTKLGFVDVLFASVSAGIGEELLFRGGIQYYLGIWITALLFIIIHGYLNPSDSRLFLYGVMMVFMSAGLGYLAAYLGLISAIVAHTVFDIVMFRHLIKKNRNVNDQSTN